MNCEALKKYITIDQDGGGEPIKDIVMRYKNEPVLEVNFYDDMVITVKSAERLGEYTMKTPADWENIKVYQELKS